MDVYGAFQLCSIAVLAGPVTVRISKTYFNTPGRNLIFIWTGMILAGLLSLTVEFFRTRPVACSHSDFTYGVDNACGLTCSVDLGPWSPLRGGAQNNIYVIRTPDQLPFGAATLLAAGCCIPAVLSLVSMWQKILKANWKRRFGGDDDIGDDWHQPISGTNAATPEKMSLVNERIRFYLSLIEIPVFGAAIFAIIIAGERNFFSYQVDYMTEPIASVGQWAPIVGTGLAAVGSLYALLAQGLEDEESKRAESPPHHCTCSHQHHTNGNESTKTSSERPQREEIELSAVESDTDDVAISQQPTYETVATHPNATRQATHTTVTDALERYGTVGTTTSSAAATDAGNRRKVARALEKIGQKLGTPAPGTFDDSAFKMGDAADFPTVPGEEVRNPELEKIKATYNPPRDSDGNATPLRRQRSRAGSFAGSVVSGLGIEDWSEADDMHRIASASAAAGARPGKQSLDRPRGRRATLEVPKQVYHSPVQRKNSSFDSSPSPDVLENEETNPISPTIKVSPES